MRHRTMIAISALLLLIGCAHERRQAPHPATPPEAAPQPAPGASHPGAQGAPQQPAPTPQPSALPQPSASPPAPTAATEPGTRRGGAAGSAGSTPGANAKTRAPERGETAAAVPRSAVPASAASGGAAAAGTAEAHPAPSSTPTLDLASLEQRLKDTRAIGLFTKLSLKNQVDDLLGEFRTFHRGEHSVTLAALRQKYDLLLLKVLSLLQDGDPPLAAAISSSREAIWEILIDPQKFEKLASN